MVNWKEVAKFSSGVAAWEAVMHASLGLSGTLPITLLGFTITTTINTIQIIIPAVVSFVLAYYGWVKK